MRGGKIKVLKINKLKIFMVFLGVVFPILLIISAAYYFGFLTGSTEFNDPCKKLSDMENCNGKKGCLWHEKKENCKMTDKCTKVKSQQECSEGCVWNTSIKRYNSNLYGLCVPIFET